jgi:hypothetical protein
MKMNLLMAQAITGGLTQTSKLSTPSFGLPSKHCNVGSKLRNVEGSVCAQCYTFRHHYTFEPVINKLDQRYELLTSAYQDGEIQQWINSMAFLISVSTNKHFRWHDSGDLQGVWHLDTIVKVCEQTKDVKHWLPTREYDVVEEYVRYGGKIPKNLVIRLSATMVNGEPPTELANKLGVHTSSVVRKDYNCPATEQGNKCLDCTKCYDKRVKNISYHKK